MTKFTVPTPEGPVQIDGPCRYCGIRRPRADGDALTLRDKRGRLNWVCPTTCAPHLKSPLIAHLCMYAAEADTYLFGLSAEHLVDMAISQLPATMRKFSVPQLRGMLSRAAKPPTLPPV